MAKSLDTSNPGALKKAVRFLQVRTSSVQDSVATVQDSVAALEAAEVVVTRTTITTSDTSQWVTSGINRFGNAISFNAGDDDLILGAIYTIDVLNNFGAVNLGGGVSLVYRSLGDTSESFYDKASVTLGKGRYEISRRFEDYYAIEKLSYTNTEDSYLRITANTTCNVTSLPPGALVVLGRDDATPVRLTIDLAKIEDKYSFHLKTPTNLTGTGDLDWTGETQGATVVDIDSGDETTITGPLVLVPGAYYRVNIITDTLNRFLQIIRIS